jgi:subtilisin family serine protease
MIALAILLAGIISVAALQKYSHRVPNVVAVQVQPSVSCAEAISAVLLEAGCDVILRTDVKTQLASMCSYEVVNACEHLSAISGVEGFIEWFFVRSLDLPTLVVGTVKSATNPVTDAIHTITGVLDARNKLGLTGAGIKVAIIDYGVYYLHPALGGGFGPGYKVAFGYDLVGDNYDGTSASIVPDNDPIDNCTGTAHGTHVAGIVVANGLNVTTPGYIPAFPFTGVAPGATLGAYRVFGCAIQTTTSDIIAAAIFRAAQDGADIISLSLGGFGYSDEIDAVAAQIVGKAGHIVLADNGNDGIAGAYNVDDPGVSLGGFGIASFDNVQYPGYTLYVDGTAYFYSLGSNNENFTFNVPLSSQIVVNNPNAAANQVLDDGCNAIDVKVTGKALLLYWAEPFACGSETRCNNAAAAGASACIIYYQSDNVQQTISGSQLIPSLITSLSAGKAIIADLAAKKQPVVVPTKTYTNLPLATVGTLSYFSSPGLSNDLFIKPDLGGIGGDVYSTISPFAAQFNGLSNAYAVYSGTSMATPYVAGCLALLLQKRGKIGFDASRAYLQNTATVTNIYNTSLVHSPAYQGAGLVNIYKAAASGTLVTPSSLSLNDTVYSKRAVTIQIQNNYGFPLTYQITHTPAATVNTFNSGDDFVLDQSTTTFTSNNVATVIFPNGRTTSYSITVRPGNAATISLTMIAPLPRAPDLWPLYGGYIAVANSYDSIVTHVPYAGVAGVWSNRDIWARNSTSLYNRWALDNPMGPYGLFGTKPTSTGTGLYADTTFTPLTNLGVVNASNYGLLLTPIASSTRSGNVTITYLCKDDTAVQAASTH